MAKQPGNLSSLIRDKLDIPRDSPEIYEAGWIVEAGDGVARAYGLRRAMAGELVTIGEKATGMVFNLEEDTIGIVLLSSDTEVKEGDVVKGTGRTVSVPVGEGLIGRVVDPLGRPLDGKGPIPYDRVRTVEAPSPGIVDREPVRTPLITGLKAVDAMVPIGRGQRELIIGDRQTGKSAIAIDAIIAQKGQGVICIYVAVGQKKSTIAQVIRSLEENGAMGHTIVVAAAASELAPMQYLGPYAGCAMAEEFMYNGKDVLIVYDDLSKHAIAYRATSLLLRRPPGREAFPGDIFYIHSRLLERSAKLASRLGGGSMTALPIVETLAGDVSAYIPTNIISITDGQIYLDSELFFSGVRPAVNVGLSVSRVGGDAQIAAMKKIAGRLRLDLAQYRELATFARFGTELDEATKARLERGKRVVEVLKQPQYQPLPVEEQVAIIFAVVRGYLDDIDVEWVEDFERDLLQSLRRHPDLLSDIRNATDFDEGLESRLAKAIEEFRDKFRGTRQGDKPSGPEITSRIQPQGDVERQVVEGA
ncbi:MAG TPA: F0F1 ATP synthase subunit alpha [Firmicutes bacterium]|nr:F0F1 ATP synthase subunit alpha [Bacillota bacterium]